MESGAHVTVDWLVGALWLLTMSFGAAAAKLVYGKVASMASSLDEIAHTVRELDRNFVKADTRLDEHDRRLEQVESVCRAQHQPGK